MYDEHVDHLRGDRIAGTGFTYECLWRARLMLRLDTHDRLQVFRGEDICISKLNKNTIFYQVKHSIRAWPPGELRGIFARPDQELTSDPTLSYFFCTNAPRTSPEADAVLNDMTTKFGSRFGMLVWEPNAEDPADRVRSDLSNLLERLSPPSSRVIRLADVEACCARLLALEATFKLEQVAEVTGEQVWQQVGLSDLLQALPARVFGSSVVQWTEWVMRATNHSGIPADPVFEATQQVTAKSRGVSTSSEEDVRKHVSNWLASPPGSRIVLISLPSGTGKTWLLLGLGRWFSDLVPTYWVDTLQEPDRADLPGITAWLDRPALLLVDDLFEHEWDSPIAHGLRADPPMLVVATTSKPRHSTAIAQLRRRVGTERLLLPELEGLLSDADRTALVGSIRAGLVSRREERDLLQTNIRHAVRVLEPTVDRGELAETLRSLWRRDDQQPWAMPLILCSSLGVRLPISLLRECARAERSASRELPDDLSALLLRARREEEQWLWIEEPEAARRALTLIAEDVGQAAIDSAVVRSATSLMGSVDSGRATHRFLGRRLTREFTEEYPLFRDLFFEPCEPKILQILEHERAWALAYVWLPLLPERHRSKEAQKAAARLTTQLGAPDSVSEVVLLVHSLGDARVSKMAEQALAAASSWPVEPWARFFEHLRPLDRELKKGLLRGAFRILRHAPVAFCDLIDRRNVGVELLKGAEDAGSPQDRDWVLGEVEPLLSDEGTTAVRSRQNRLLTKYLDLCGRALMQRRSAIAIPTVVKFCSLFEKRPAALPWLLGSTYDQYRELYDKEASTTRHMRALALGLSFAQSEAPPMQRHQVWTKLVSFAEDWTTLTDWRRLRREAYHFLSEVMPYVGSGKLFEAFTLQCARGNVARHDWEADALKVLVQFMERMSGNAAVQLFVLITGTLAQNGPHPASLRSTATLLLRSACSSATAEAALYGERLLRELAEWLQVDVSPVMAVADQFRHELPAPVVIDLLNSLRHCEWSETDGMALAKAAFARWSRAPSPIQLPLLLMLLGLGASGEARHAIDAMLTTSTGSEGTIASDAHCLAGSWEARFGDVASAVEHLGASLKEYERVGSGAHPLNAARAYRLLGSRLPPPAGQILELCAELTDVGPLRSPEDVLVLECGHAASSANSP